MSNPQFLFDLRPLQRGTATGVSEITAGLCQALAAALPAGALLGVGNAATAEERDRLLALGVPVVARRWPNKLVHASMLAFRRPTLESLAGLAGPATVIASPHFLSVRPDSRLFLIVHDLSFLRAPEWFTRRERLWHQAIGLGRQIARADRIIAFSEHTARDLHHFFSVPPDKVLRLTPGLAADLYIPPSSISQDALRARFRLPKDFLLFFGAGERKNLPAALAALRELPGEVLAVAGPVRSAHVQRLAKQFGVASQIRTLGFLSRDQYRTALGAAGALLYPSFYEGIGLPPLHALAQSTPVIASHVSAVSEFLGPYAVLVDPYDASAIVAAVKLIRSAPDAWSARAAAGRAWVETFSWQVAVGKIMEAQAVVRRAGYRYQPGTAFIGTGKM